MIPQGLRSEGACLRLPHPPCYATNCDPLFLDRSHRLVRFGVIRELFRFYNVKIALTNYCNLLSANNQKISTYQIKNIVVATKSANQMYFS